MKGIWVGWAVVAVALLQASVASAQDTRFELGVQVASTHSWQFDAGDAGIGGRAAWRPSSLLGIEAELNLYPRGFPDRRPFSRTRVEGLFGVTAGVTLGRVRPFARLRPGFVDVHASPEPFVDVALTRRTFVRFDVGDRLVRYPGPVFESNPRRIRERPFFGHDFRFATGAGLGF
ncbi:MAG: hypothetical protein HYU37_21145 [Acidobacteria bacterium]|nr:hypothetical protein [Acidobacteriota bacterium]